MSELRAGTPLVDWSDVGVSELPTGTVTLLLADVEGSTLLWETQPDHMAAAIELLDATVSAALVTHAGIRPIEQGEGDSFVIAFGCASDAVACALDLQRAKLSPIRLRIGIHTGEVRLRDAGNYIGPTINRTARLRDLGHGGQTLLSGVTAALTEDQLPKGASLTDLGTHALRDLPRPERVVQLCHPDIRNECPPLRTPATVATHGIPIQLTTFIGRQAETTHLREALVTNRSVTLTGAGGAGKTGSGFTSRLRWSGISVTAFGTSTSRRSPIRTPCPSPPPARSGCPTNRAARQRTPCCGSSATDGSSGCSTTVSMSSRRAPRSSPRYSVPRRASPSSPRAGNRSAYPAKRCGKCRPCRSPTRPSNCSPTEPASRAPASPSPRTTPRPSPRFITGLTACRWRSSSPLPGCGHCLSPRSWTASTIASDCSLEARARPCAGSRRCELRWTGHTRSSPSLSAFSSAAWRCSSAASICPPYGPSRRPM